ncbi:annexin A8 [Microcaecilia unicolor]|uniref:Annexin A8 n=1 Tax=Microcaecilia unicolor TaxID=1415580 RepID=A0A6P7Y7B7_9AMPH|nr:annexin A8 [Microcaecilia unicolor]
MLLLYVCLVWFSGKGMAEENPGNWWDGWDQYKGIAKIGQVADPKEDAKKLHNAMEGWGADKTTINNILTGRTNMQRQEISSAYFNIYGEDLITNLRNILEGDHQTLIISLMFEPNKFYGVQLHNAMQGLGTDESVISEIFATHTPDKLSEIADIYEKEFHTTLMKDLEGDTSGSFLHLLKAIVQGERGDLSTDVDEALVATDVKTLHPAGVWMLGTYEEKFVDILGARSGRHLLRVCEEYEKQYGQSIEEGIKKETSYPFQELALALVSSTKNVYEYYANQLHNAMEGLGTNENTLIRICVGRSEIDLPYIKAKFEETFGISLPKMVTEETSGDFGSGLQAVINS